MYQFGGTIGWSQTPFYMRENCNLNHMLPRPVVSCRPGNFGHLLLNEDNWLRYLSQIVECHTLYLLKDDNKSMSREILEKTKVCKKIIPKCLRICGTFFTSMIVVGDFSGTGYIPLHTDKDDYINAIVSIGNSEVSGGSTVYYSGKNNKQFAHKQYTIPFKHGQIQIGYFDDVLHGADTWENGCRGVINFSMKKKIFKHFQQYGMKYYSQFVNKGYPSGLFIAK